MSLFRPFPITGNSGSDFGPLFRLLDDYDIHRASRDQTNGTVNTYAPRFDVRETKDSYNLDGELPGALQKDVEIEFSDPQTLVIKGHSERQYRNPSNKEEEDHRYWVSERSTGEFQRVFHFPGTC